EEERKQEEAEKAAEEERKQEEAEKAAEEERKQEEAEKAAEEERKQEEAEKAAEEDEEVVDRNMLGSRHFAFGPFSQRLLCDDDVFITLQLVDGRIRDFDVES
ncbi:hypothetical protein LLU09_12570, partial [Salinicoccus sp. RF5]|nr:hypothetical protein [Salinicoccus sp. RF5]